MFKILSHGSLGLLVSVFFFTNSARASQGIESSFEFDIANPDWETAFYSDPFGFGTNDRYDRSLVVHDVIQAGLRVAECGVNSSCVIDTEYQRLVGEAVRQATVLKSILDGQGRRRANVNDAFRRFWDTYRLARVAFINAAEAASDFEHLPGWGAPTEYETQLDAWDEFVQYSTELKKLMLEPDHIDGQITVPVGLQINRQRNRFQGSYAIRFPNGRVDPVYGGFKEFLDRWQYYRQRGSAWRAGTCTLYSVEETIGSDRRPLFKHAIGIASNHRGRDRDVNPVGSAYGYFGRSLRSQPAGSDPHFTTLTMSLNEMIRAGVCSTPQPTTCYGKIDPRRNLYEITIGDYSLGVGGRFNDSYFVMQIQNRTYGDAFVRNNRFCTSVVPVRDTTRPTPPVRPRPPRRR